MSSKRTFHLGPGAASLLLVVVVVCMAMLGLLSLMSVRSDVKLTERSLSLVIAGYDAQAAAQRRLSELDAMLLTCDSATLADSLPEGMMLSGDTVSFEVPTGTGATLSVAVRILSPGSGTRYQVIAYTLSGQQPETLDELSGWSESQAPHEAADEDAAVYIAE